MRALFVKVALCAAVIFAPTTAKAQGKEFKQLTKIDGVEHIYINKFFIKLAAIGGKGFNLSDGISIGGGKSGNILKKIDGIRVFNADEKNPAEQLKMRVQSILNSNGWEPLIDVNDEDGEKVKIYQYKKGKRTTVAILSEEKNETELVVITGKIDLEKLIEQANKD